MEVNYTLPQMKHIEEKGLVSVIVPIYNNEVYLRDCLDSIMVQTFTNWEAILVNDGSTDSTEKIVDEYVKKDSRFVAVHKKNEGTLLARKAGLEHSRGEFIANIDHDDLYHPWFLERMYRKITKTSADFVWCKYRGQNSQTSGYEWSMNPSENITAVLLWQELTGFTWDKLIRKEVYSKIHYPDKYLTWGEDIIQIIQVCFHSKSAVFIPEVLYCHRPGGISSNYTTPIYRIKFSIILKNILEFLLLEEFPQNVKKVFCSSLYYYYLLDKETREEFRTELEPFLCEVIKYSKNLNIKLCLFLAIIGLEFLIKLREKIKKGKCYIVKKWKKKCIFNFGAY